MYCKHVQNNQYPPISAFYFYFVSKPPVSLYPYRFKEICFHLTLPLADRMMKSYGVTILMKRLQQYFQMVNTINIACGSNFRVCGWNPMVLLFEWNLFSSTFTW